MKPPRPPKTTTDEALVWDYLAELARWWLDVRAGKRYPLRDVVKQGLVDLDDMSKRLNQGVLL